MQTDRTWRGIVGSGWRPARTKCGIIHKHSVMILLHTLESQIGAPSRRGAFIWLSTNKDIISRAQRRTRTPPLRSPSASPAICKQTEIRQAVTLSTTTAMPCKCLLRCRSNSRRASLSPFRLTEFAACTCARRRHRVSAASPITSCFAPVPRPYYELEV